MFLITTIITLDMTSLATSDRHLSKFAKRPKMPLPTALDRILGGGVLPAPPIGGHFVIFNVTSVASIALCLRNFQYIGIFFGKDSSNISVIS